MVKVRIGYRSTNPLVFITKVCVVTVALFDGAAESTLAPSGKQKVGRP